MECLKFACRNDNQPLGCEYCSKYNWIGALVRRLPQPIPDRENPGHFLSVLKTPQEYRVPDDWQPRAYIKKMFKDGKISLDDGKLIEITAKKLNVIKCHVVSYIENQRNFEAGQEKQAKEKGEKKINKEGMKMRTMTGFKLLLMEQLISE